MQLSEGCRKMSIEELRQCELSILEKVDSFCRTNGIKYWLDKGSLLGAVRHNGFIPWDDDIDIGMLRKDFERFAAEFTDDTGRYEFISVYKSRDCYIPYGKVIDSHTEMIEDGKFLTSVNIDVNVYDTAPEDRGEAMAIFKKRDEYRKLAALQRERTEELGHGLKKLVKLLRRSLLRLFGNDHFIKKMIKNARSAEGKQTGLLANFLEYGTCVVNEDVFAEVTECSFEGRGYPVPIGYDELLCRYYGDYMKLPPEEKQKTHHDFSAAFK